ncbi:hypothetical protein F7725_022012 [Dissostichus mawsoni]|uniref:Uncharacterized protein n=1 Tax=Dissostichus mawsoni TaxID=36200 RepID=A0A7J5ZG42_DISMA|nr:hypothetical protein F7725_022006 [Dissostichus mawsoni]KAF3859613.1 hypothetical protein F7725_022012 [Dissostichus mawsoni]
MASTVYYECVRSLSEKLLLKPKAAKSLQTERVPRSSVLDRLQSFLPQMAEANEKLKQQMAEAPAGTFDIESVEEAEKVIEMDVALVELSGSESDSEEYGRIQILRRNRRATSQSRASNYLERRARRIKQTFRS